MPAMKRRTFEAAPFLKSTNEPPNKRPRQLPDVEAGVHASQTLREEYKANTVPHSMKTSNEKCTKCNLNSASINKILLVREVLLKSKEFLGSLSNSASIKHCHPVARSFKINFSRKKQELTTRLFNMYNTLVFNSRLPRDMEIAWSTRMNRTAGKCFYKGSGKSKVILSKIIIDRSERLRDVLLHELCHAAVWTVDGVRGGHGPLWQKWVARSKKIFPDLPPVTRLHSYNLTPKYLVHCNNCNTASKCFKLIRVENKHCRSCFGSVQLTPYKQLTRDGNTCTQKP